MARIVSLFIAAVVAFFGLSASAQTCRISGTNGDTIEVFESSLNGNTINVTLSSDSQSAANVEVTVEVTYVNKYNLSSKETQTYSKKCLARPSQSTLVSITVPETINNTFTLSDYKVKSITGVKCM